MTSPPLRDSFTLVLEDEDGKSTTHTLSSAELPQRPKDDEEKRLGGLSDLTKLDSLRVAGVDQT